MTKGTTKQKSQVCRMTHALWLFCMKISRDSKTPFCLVFEEVGSSQIKLGQIFKSIFFNQSTCFWLNFLGTPDVFSFLLTMRITPKNCMWEKHFSLYCVIKRQITEISFPNLACVLFTRSSLTYAPFLKFLKMFDFVVFLKNQIL